MFCGKVKVINLNVVKKSLIWKLLWRQQSELTRVYNLMLKLYDYVKITSCEQGSDVSISCPIATTWTDLGVWNIRCEWEHVRFCLDFHYIQFTAGINIEAIPQYHSHLPKKIKMPHFLEYYNLTVMYSFIIVYRHWMILF